MSMAFMGDYAEFKRGPDKKKRRRRRRSVQSANVARRDRAYSGNPYYATKTDRNIRRTEMGTRSIRNAASGLRASSDVSREVRSWLKVMREIRGGQ